MTMRRVLVTALTALVALTPSMAMAQAQQAMGTISGKANDEARQPYTDYIVVLRDVATGQQIATRPLDPEAKFSFTNVPLNARYLVELVHAKQNKVVCTEGPYGLVANQAVTFSDVNVDCDKSPALLILLVGGVAAAALIGTTASGSR